MNCHEIQKKDQAADPDAKGRGKTMNRTRRVLHAAGRGILVVLGNALYALTVRLFLMPADLVTGGTTGMALAVNRYTGLAVSDFVLAFNVLMLLVGWALLGRGFALTTVLSTFVYPAALKLLDGLFCDRVLTEDLWLCTVFSGLGIGLSLGMVIRAGASTGGMDIPPLVLNRFFHIPVSAGLYAFDILILMLQAVYSPVERLLYGIVLVFLYTVTLDKVLLMGKTRTEVKVISRCYPQIREAILTRLDRGVTMVCAESGYLKKPTQMVLSIISNRELPRLEQIIREIDPQSLIIVSRVSEVNGRGFTEKKEYLRRMQPDPEEMPENMQLGNGNGQQSSKF